MQKKIFRKWVPSGHFFCIMWPDCFPLLLWSLSPSLSLPPSLPPVEVSFKFLLKKPGRVNRKMFMETGTLETSKKEEKKRVCNKVKRPKDSALSSLVL
jgi:hypothetical protein